MRYWLYLPQIGEPATVENVDRYVELIEQSGLVGAWVGDHITNPVNNPTSYPYHPVNPLQEATPYLHGYTTLAYAAGRSSRMRLMMAVAVVPLRHPLIHAKIVASLDVLSRGRLEVGFGSGWFAEEFAALNADFEQRGTVTDEYLDVMRTAWAGQEFTHVSERLSIDRVFCLPRPVQDPLPLWIGGNTEPAMRRARRLHANWVPSGVTVAALGELIAKIGKVSDGELDGRRPGRIGVTVFLDRSENVREGDTAVSVEDGTLAVFDALKALSVTDVLLSARRLPQAVALDQCASLVGALDETGRLRPQQSTTCRVPPG